MMPPENRKVDPGPRSKTRTTIQTSTRIEVRLVIDVPGEHISPGRLTEMVMRAVENGITGITILSANGKEK